jgi:hypothetical protein
MNSLTHGCAGKSRANVRASGGGLDVSRGLSDTVFASTRYDHSEAVDMRGGGIKVCLVEQDESVSFVRLWAGSRCHPGNRWGRCLQRQTKTVRQRIDMRIDESRMVRTDLCPLFALPNTLDFLPRLVRTSMPSTHEPILTEKPRTTSPLLVSVMAMGEGIQSVPKAFLRCIP